MSEFLSLLLSRIRAPFFGYFISSFVVINWKALFFLIVHNGPVIERFQYFEQHTGYFSLLLYPGGAALLLTVFYPWISLGLLWTVKYVNTLRTDMQLDNDNYKLVKQQEFELKRRKLLGALEVEEIASAQRDELVEKIEDEEVKKTVKEKLKDLRTDEFEYAGKSRLNEFISNLISLSNELNHQIHFIHKSCVEFIGKHKLSPTDSISVEALIRTSMQLSTSNKSLSLVLNDINSVEFVEVKRSQVEVINTIYSSIRLGIDTLKEQVNQFSIFIDDNIPRNKALLETLDIHIIGLMESSTEVERILRGYSGN